MTTFFVIFFVLILVNAALLLHSSFYSRGSKNKVADNIDKQPDIKVYPIDMIPSDYKKAI